MVSVGDNIDAYCLKCKLVLAHVILFKVDDAVNRVKCKTCGAEHKYRATLPGTKKPAAPRSSGVARTKKSVTAKVAVNDAPLQWDLKTRNTPPETPMRHYSLRDNFKANEVINHPVFGVGFVERVVDGKSISVLFHDAVRLMGMNVAQSFDASSVASITQSCWSVSC